MAKRGTVIAGLLGALGLAWSWRSAADGDQTSRVLASLRPADQLSYRGLDFGDAECQRAFGRAGKVPRQEGRRFQACLATLVAGANPPLELEGIGSGPTHSTITLASPRLRLQLHCVHDQRKRGAARLTEEHLTSAELYDRDAAKAHLIARLPGGGEHVVPGEATQRAMQAAKVARVSTRVRVCVDENGNMSSCGVDGNSAIREYDQDVTTRVCTMGKLGAYQPDGVPIKVCAVIDVSSP
jgi:hypothetical protein